jgi:hypothetical protein
VLPNLTIYGDLKPEQIKMPKGLLRGGLEKVGLITAGESNTKAIIPLDHRFVED